MPFGRALRKTYTDIAFHSLSTDVSFLTAIFRARSGPEILSASHAAKLLESVVGYTTKLNDITIKPLTPDTWFLTTLVYHYSDIALRGTGRPVSALPSLKLNRADAASPRDDGGPSDDVDDETSSDDYKNNGDEEDEYSSEVVDEASSSRKHSRWSEEDDNRLRRWKEEGKPWGWICRQFSNRSPGAVQVRWHTKLRGKA
jgi:hypothetical protein